MKRSTKVSRIFRLAKTLDLQLRKRAEVTGINQTRILENALMRYFRNGMNDDLKQASDKIRSFDHGLERTPSLPIAA